MKMTLLDICQDVLASIDGDEVNSITDNIEVEQVSRIVRSTYYDIVTRANLPEHYFLFGLEASTDINKPTLMTMPASASSLLWVKYDLQTLDDTDKNFQILWTTPLEDFFANMHLLQESDANVVSFQHTVNGETYTLLGRNDAHPTYYTTFDDNSVLFNSYNATIDSTLQKSKTLCYGRRSIPFSFQDSFIPELDDDQFPLLLAEAKATAWAEMKQAANQRQERSARRGWLTLQRTKHRTSTNAPFVPNYGRK